VLAKFGRYFVTRATAILDHVAIVGKRWAAAELTGILLGRA
jgi:hypothetical protein